MSSTVRSSASSSVRGAVAERTNLASDRLAEGCSSAGGGYTKCIAPTLERVAARDERVGTRLVGTEGEICDAVLRDRSALSSGMAASRLLPLLALSGAFRVYNDNQTYTIFTPYEEGFVGRTEDAATSSASA